MGPLARFLVALERLARRQGFKIEDAYKFAKQEFGEVTPLLRKQIQNVYKKIKEKIPGKPGEKGRVLPFVKKTEGIETLDVPTEQKPSDTDLTRLGIENLKNPRRPGGPLDPVTGITRTIARRILDKKGIKIDRREDPLDIFANNFGIGAGTDIQNLGEEIAEAETSGRKLKPLDDLIEIEGFFDLEVQKNPDKGMSDQEVLDMLEKDLKEKETLSDKDFKNELTSFRLNIAKNSPDFNQDLADRIIKREIYTDLSDSQRKQFLDDLDFVLKNPRDGNAQGGLAGIINL